MSSTDYARNIVEERPLWGLPNDLVQSFIGKQVLITGACGSIGGALFDTFTRAGIRVRGVDWDELSVARKNTELTSRIELGDFVDADVRGLDVIFHCAAYKHVEMGEGHREAFLANNYHKTCQLSRVASNISPNCKFVLISTDKAAGTSWMGRTKKMAEEYVVGREGVAIRMVNVAYSRGSVLDNWRSQPFPWLNHRDMRRYFLTQEDALRVILEASELEAGLYTVYNMPDVELGHLADVYFSKHGKVIQYRPGLRAGEVRAERLIREDERLEPITSRISRVCSRC